MPLPLEQAHVIPWSKSHEHSVENLVALCANCHSRADNEKWGVETLRKLKKEPCILYRKSHSPDYTDTAVKQFAEMLVEGQLQSMQNRITELEAKLAAYTGTPLSGTKVLSAEPANSVRFLIQLVAPAGQKLVQGFERHDPLLFAFLDDIQLLSVRLVSAPPNRVQSKRQATDTSEAGLEKLIVESLVNEASYEQGEPAEYDRDLCVDRERVFRFLRSTQPEVAEKIGIGKTTAAEDKFLGRLSDKIKTEGIVEVLRKGIRDGQHEITLYYPQPASRHNPKASQHYQANIFSVTRQLRFSSDHKRLALDLVIFINGLPLITFELKNNLTKQNVWDAMEQYRKDRASREPLFGFGRCLVHFAVDDNLVYMTTHLRDESTFFLPFNLGLGDNGAGNPVNPFGLKTDYLWKQILTKPSLSNIIEKYAQVVEEVDEDTGKKKRKLIFPRYHQLDAVRKILAHAHEHGAGTRYLIQHSAGSGKSNSIAWLAHQLVEISDPSEENKVFDSVIVVTDRKVLDKQIRDTIKQFAHVQGVVQAITEGSGQLRKALEEGKKIIITTIQKFPFVVRDIQKLGDKHFAIIIDEAHSSQSGRAAAAMNVALGSEEHLEEETDEDRINRIIEEQKLLQNASYFAFTATPKNKTLQLFGIENPQTGKFHPFHSYSMKQAIEEKFILDVLQNYTTYQSFYHIRKKIEDDPQFDKIRARKKLKKYVEGHKVAIRQKTEVMVDHFEEKVYRPRKIGGKAKAMIVTSSILNAIKYRLAFDNYLREIKAPYKALVAFTGSKEYEGRKYDESTMNGFPSTDIPKEFKKAEYRFLIVAEKFQTGFDQPLLHTMYVDKVLTDVKAVQTLSRLNRAYPGKNDVFVLDFVNSTEEIREGFEPFYKTTVLSEGTDINRLNDLQDKLDGFQVYSRNHVDGLMSLFINGAPRDDLDPILDACAETYKNDLNNDDKINFKQMAKTFVRTYQFLSLIVPFNNIYWESLKTFLRLLIPKLTAPEDEDLARGIIESIDMDSYRVEQQEVQAKITPEGGEEISPTPPEPRKTAEIAEIDFLSNIVRDFNERWGTNWTDHDKVLLFERLPVEVAQDVEYQNAKQSGDRQNAKITYAKKLEEQFRKMLFSHTELYRKFADDLDFREWILDVLFRQDYDSPKDQAASAL
jgi:type I restriction enzyme R subunit